MAAPAVWVQTSLSFVETLPSPPPPVPAGGQRRSQQRRDLFLQFDQCLGPLGTLLPARALTLQLGDPLVARIGHPPHGAALRRCPGQLPPFPRRAPRRQMGGVQPSRRNNAPTAPGVLQAPASRTIFRLYSTVNRRRVAFATTSIAGPPRPSSNAPTPLQS